MSDRDDADKPQGLRKRWTRRRFLKYAGGGLLLAAGAGALEAFVIGPYHIEVTHPSIAIAGLPKAWEGVRVAQITDLHVGPLIGLDTIRRAVRMTNDESPDLIAATGDYVTGRRALDGELVNVLRELRAPMGKFAVLGNHDHWTGRIKTVNEMLVAAGFTLLTNTHAIIERDGDALCIAGVDDLWEGRQLIEQARTIQQWFALPAVDLRPHWSGDLHNERPRAFATVRDGRTRQAAHQVARPLP